MKVFIGADHAAFKLKEELKKWLKGKGHRVEDLGTYSEESADYPDYAGKVARKVARTKGSVGVLACGTGIGMSMAANKIKGVRAAVAWNRKSAQLARQHNNANVLCVGARMLGPKKAKEIVQAYFSAKFEGGRHLRRVKKIAGLEK